VRRSSHVMSAYIGLDVHKDFTFATVLDQDGRVVVQRKLANEHVPSFLARKATTLINYWQQFSIEIQTPKTWSAAGARVERCLRCQQSLKKYKSVH